MTTKVKYNELYNELVKKDFLIESISSGKITKDTSANYERIFNITEKLERALQKDLNRFSFLELETVLRNFKTNNRNTIETYARIISSYLNWSVEKGLIEKNNLKELKPNDFERYIINNESYISLNNLRRYESGCYNAQDAVIIRLLFMGVGGKQLSEIRNLKKTDIQGNILFLTNTLQEDEETGEPLKFTTRYLEVDDRTIELINNAILQKTYRKRNGELRQTETGNVREYTNLINNDYVIRPSLTKNGSNLNKPVDKFVIYKRIEVISETLGIENFTTKFIQRSGMIYFTNELLKINNEKDVSLDDMKIVADRFNVKSYHNLKGFVNIKNIELTYAKE